MKVRMSIHTGKTLILNRRQTVACERFGAKIDCEVTPELIPEGSSDLAHELLDKHVAVNAGWTELWPVVQRFIKLGCQSARLDWADGSFLILEKIPH